MKNSVKLPAVLAVSLLLIFAQTAGAFFAKSLSLFAYAAVIIAVSFSALPSIINTFSAGGKAFVRAQFKALLINSVLLTFLSLFIICKSFINLQQSLEINIALTCWTAFAGFFGLCVCSAILFSAIKSGKPFKMLFFKYFSAAALSFFVIIGTVFYYLKDLYFLDSAISAALAVLAIVQSAALIRFSVNFLRKKTI